MKLFADNPYHHFTGHTSLWSRILRFLHCLWFRHDAVDGSESLWCGSCGKEWPRQPVRSA